MKCAEQFSKQPRKELIFIELCFFRREETKKNMPSLRNNRKNTYTADILKNWKKPKKQSLAKIMLSGISQKKICLTVIMPLSNGLMNRVFTNGLGDQGSIPDRVIPKTPKMILDVTLLNTQHYKV